MNERRQTLMPSPPQWALDAGLPPPQPNEDFCGYVTRLGYSCSELLEGLVPRTMSNAHVRLVHKLADSLPDAWNAHVQVFVRAHVKPKPAAKPIPFRR